MYNYIKMPFKKCETLEHILFCKKKKIPSEKKS